MPKHHTRARMLAAFGPGRGPAWRDAPDDTGDANPGGGSGGGDGGQDNTGGGDDAGDGAKPKIEGDLDKDRAANSIAAARAAEKKARDEAKAIKTGQQALIDNLAVVLGLKPDPKSDPAAMAAQAAKELTEARAEIRAATTENALLRLAGPAGGDVEALRDSRNFMTKLAELDPADADFDAKVTTAVKDAVKANSKLSATTGQGPGRMGADMGGGGNNSQRPSSIAEAMRRRANGTK